MKISRRKSLKLGIAASATLAAPQFIFAQGEFSNSPTGSDVTFGIVTTQTGPNADNGSSVLMGVKLAVEHLNGAGNGGMLQTFSDSLLSGNGVLGKKVKWVSGDDQGMADAARHAARSLVERERATACFGSVSTSTALAVQRYCSDIGISFFPGNINGKRFTDDYAYRFSMTSQAAAQKVIEHLGRRFAKGTRIATIASDHPNGLFTADVMEESAIALGWDIAPRRVIPFGDADVSNIQNDPPDIVLVCSQGRSAAKILNELNSLGLQDRAQIAMPVLDSLTLKTAGQAANGIIGASDWNAVPEHDGNNEFVKEFETKFNLNPDVFSYVAYAQTLLYANAVARAGSFHPDAVKEVMNGYEFDGLGCGASLMLGSNELQKSILIGRATGSTESWFSAFDIEAICPMCGTNAPQTCSKNACAQGYCCKDSKCVLC